MPRPKKTAPNRSDGRYEVKITLGKDVEGKPIRKSFYSEVSLADARKQAEAYKVAFEIERQTGEAVLPKQTAFKEWAEKWLTTYKKEAVSQNTYLLTYKSTVEKHLVPYFGARRLIDITPADIQAFWNSKKDMSMSMQHKMRLCLNGIFESAIENDKCIKNPVKAKTVSYAGAATPKEKTVYTDEQITKIEKYALERMPEVVLLLETGVRRGELLGLMAEDYDGVHNAITINRSIADRHGGGVSEEPPKWNSYRVIPLSPLALEVIQGTGIKSGYLFSGSDSRPQSPNTWSQKFARFMKEMAENNPDVPELTAHELRHTYGTMLRRREVDIFTIQKLLGHKDIKVTTETYVHNEIETLKKALGY